MLISILEAQRNVVHFTIEIPNDILQDAPDRAKQKITKEMALSLYQRKIISMGTES